MKSEIDGLLKTPRLSELLVVANTPSFLYRRYRENQAVQSVGEVIPTADILDYLATKERDIGSVEDLACFYGALVALSLKSDRLSSDFLQQVPGRHPELRWIRSIVSLVLANQVGTAFMSLTVPSKIRVMPQEAEAPDFSNNQLVIGGTK